MPPISVHHTATDDQGSWDGPAEVAKAPAEEATLHYMHAWVEAGADPNAKGAYKFPHHASGTDTAANIAGVNNAMSRLSQANIPAADEAGVRAHLMAHQKDAGMMGDLAPHTHLSHEPIRVFEGTAKPGEPFWTFRNAAETESGQVEVEIYGPVSEFAWWGDEVTPRMFKDQLYGYGKNGPVTLRLNSPGGDMIAASVISAIIKDYPGHVTVKIDGVAASAAVMVAIAGDVVKIQASAYMMIHNPMVGLLGLYTVDELKGLIDELKTIKDGIVEGYMAKTKLEAEKVSKLMNDQTWMTASEAVAYGFADEVITGASKMANKVNYANVLQARYQNVPHALLPSQQPEASNQLKREAQRLAANARSILTKE